MTDAAVSKALVDVGLRHSLACEVLPPTISARRTFYRQRSQTYLKLLRAAAQQRTASGVTFEKSCQHPKQAQDPMLCDCDWLPDGIAASTDPML